jgi:hypothetical protein
MGILLGLSLSLLIATPQQQPPAAGGLDVSAIDRALGRTGQMQDGGVYRVSAPRSDLHVTVNGIAIKPGLALGSWMAFKRSETSTVAHGDLVLLGAEVNSVISALQAGGMQITAVHNHVLGESPAVMYAHFWGQGPESGLAQTLAAGLGKTATPPASAAAADTTPFKGADELQTALGRTGTVRNGVLSVSVARTERITMMGVELPPSMGMATALNFQATDDGRVAGTGDFVMIADEVNRVARVLRDQGIDITALHSHMIHGSPELYFMHFWAVGTPQKIGTALKAALAEVKTQ